MCSAAAGQVAVGYHALCQIGWGAHIWSMKLAEPAAVEFFRSLPIIRDVLPGA